MPLKHLLPIAFASLSLLLPPAPARAADCPSDLACTEHFADVHAAALTLADRFGSTRVLVVSDIDNTLLAMDQALGSTQWWNWQTELLKRSPDDPRLSASSFAGLLQVQDILFALGGMHPPESEQPRLIQDLQNRGLAVIALTSRGPESRDATRRELTRNGYFLGRTPVPPRPGLALDDPFLPFAPGNPAGIGMTAEEIAGLTTRAPAPVSYRNGVYMTAGQHKGLMLRALLARTGTGDDYEAIVFVDDGEKNVRNMVAAYPDGSGPILRGFLYTAEAPETTEFEAPAQRQHADAQWDTLAAAIDDVFGGPVPISPPSNTPPAITPPLLPADPGCPSAPVAPFRVQGDGDETPLAGCTLAVDGVVTAVFPGRDGLGGFFIQDPQGDADPATSDGIFVHAPQTQAPTPGQRVRVHGEAQEFNGKTQVGDVSAVEVLGQGAAVVPQVLSSATGLEALEGMLVSLPAGSIIADPDIRTRRGNDTLRFGEMLVALGERPFQATNLLPPDPTLATANAAIDASRTILVDDGSNSRDPDPVSVIDLGDLRGGQGIELTGALDFGFGRFRIQPVSARVVADNPRSDRPAELGGNLRIAGFNVLNYFTTLGERGATSAAELADQRSKIVAALLAIDADALGLIELENNGDGAIGDLVQGLNAAAGADTYAFVRGPVFTGDDAIRVGIIYKPQRLTPAGAAIGADPAMNPLYARFKRPPLAQAFTTPAGETFTLIVNHFKSKGCGGATGADADQNDGQGCYNATRSAQAHALLAFADETRLAAGDDDVLLIGDLNAYGAEDPVEILKQGGFTDTIATHVPEAGRYSYLFDGAVGYLDHALVSSGLAGRVAGVAIWHINADEPELLAYNGGRGLSRPDPYRSSDHDPVIVALSLPDGGSPVTPPTTGTQPIRIIAANITSGNHQSYDPGHGIRMLQGLDPDVVLIQEFNYQGNSEQDIQEMVDTAFGPGFHWFREDGAQIPNGVISRWPIAASGTWDDSKTTNRELAWARIDIPGDTDLWAVSVHLLSKSSRSSVRKGEAEELVGYIARHVPAGDYLVIGGDLNTSDAGEPALRELSRVIDITRRPSDRNGRHGTNASRAKPYDWVMPDADLLQWQVPVQIGANTYPNGLVFDSRVYRPLDDVAPVQQGDSSAPQMQHMPVVKDFLVPVQ